jgi:hypothetical protein
MLHFLSNYLFQYLKSFLIMTKNILNVLEKHFLDWIDYRGFRRKYITIYDVNKVNFEQKLSF